MTVRIFILSAPRKNEKENLGRKSLKSCENMMRKIHLNFSHVKNRPVWAVFEFCICTDSQFVDLKTDILVQRAKDSEYFPC